MPLLSLHQQGGGDAGIESSATPAKPTQTFRHGQHPSDLPRLWLSSHYLQPLSLI